MVPGRRSQTSILETWKLPWSSYGAIDCHCKEGLDKTRSNWIRKLCIGCYKLWCYISFCPMRQNLSSSHGVNYTIIQCIICDSIVELSNTFYGKWNYLTNFSLRNRHSRVRYIVFIINMSVCLMILYSFYIYSKDQRYLDIISQFTFEWLQRTVI